MAHGKNGKRDAPFSLRLTFEERARIEAQAGEMPVGAYIKSLLLAEDAPKYRKRRRAPVEARLEPEEVRYLRHDNETKCSKVKELTLPPENTDARRYVRLAVKSYPELYFARAVVLLMKLLVADLSLTT
jgi:hypothetical protein